jgi:hypothetical protein
VSSRYHQRHIFSIFLPFPVQCRPILADDSKDTNRYRSYRGSYKQDSDANAPKLVLIIVWQVRSNVIHDLTIAMYAVRVGLGACLAAVAYAASAPAVILTVIVDDLGWNNVGWHQNQTGPANATPRLTSLAKAGIILDRHYVHFTCTPSRSSYLSGRLPVHVQQTLANPDIQNSGIPRNMTALPAKLKEAGYATHVAVRHSCEALLPYVPIMTLVLNAG